MLNVQVPFIFKRIVDELNVRVTHGQTDEGDSDQGFVKQEKEETKPAAKDEGVDMKQVVLAVPVTMLIGCTCFSAHAYGVFGSLLYDVYLSSNAADGVARSTSTGMQELRNAIFATVAQRAIRRVARDVFLHLHGLDLRFHLNRQTGAIARVMDRGSRSINFVLNSMTFNVVPTILEIGLVSSILGAKCGWEYAAVTVATLTGYTAFTVGITQWR